MVCFLHRTLQSAGLILRQRPNIAYGRVYQLTRTARHGGREGVCVPRPSKWKRVLLLILWLSSPIIMALCLE